MSFIFVIRTILEYKNLGGASFLGDFLRFYILGMMPPMPETDFIENI